MTLDNTSKWKRRRLEILNRDGWTCQYCGNALTRDTATVDHIIPRKLWPHNPAAADDPTNLLAACKTCNYHKGARLLKREPAKAQKRREW